MQQLLTKIYRLIPTDQMRTYFFRNMHCVKGLQNGKMYYLMKMSTAYSNMIPAIKFNNDLRDKVHCWKRKQSLHCTKIRLNKAHLTC